MYHGEGRSLAFFMQNNWCSIIHNFTHFYFIPSSEFNAYLKQIKVILSTVKKYRIFSLVTNTIYIFSLKQTEAVSTILGLISSKKDLECTVSV